MTGESTRRVSIHAAGVVQGVGSPPLVRRQARKLAVTGSVRNHRGAVEVEAESRGGESFRVLEGDGARNADGVISSDVASCTGCMRDPARGGLATALCEIAAASRARIRIRDRDVPLRREVRTACDLLGLDPLHALEGAQLPRIC